MHYETSMLLFILFTAAIRLAKEETTLQMMCLQIYSIHYSFVDTCDIISQKTLGIHGKIGERFCFVNEIRLLAHHL